MASIKRENIGLLNDKLTVNLTPTDYLGGFEAILKKHAKTANIPGLSLIHISEPTRQP
jgi:trigger factor